MKNHLFSLLTLLTVCTSVCAEEIPDSVKAERAVMELLPAVSCYDLQMERFASYVKDAAYVKTEEFREVQRQRAFQSFTNKGGFLPDNNVDAERDKARGDFKKRFKAYAKEMKAQFPDKKALREQLVKALNDFYVTHSEHPDVYRVIGKKYKGNVEKFVKEIFFTSVLYNADKANLFLNYGGGMDKNVLLQDEGFHLAWSFYGFCKGEEMDFPVPEKKESPARIGF